MFFGTLPSDVLISLVTRSTNFQIYELRKWSGATKLTCDYFVSKTRAANRGFSAKGRCGKSLIFTSQVKTETENVVPKKYSFLKLLNFQHFSTFHLFSFNLSSTGYKLYYRNEILFLSI